MNAGNIEKIENPKWIEGGRQNRSTSTHTYTHMLPKECFVVKFAVQWSDHWCQNDNVFCENGGTRQENGTKKIPQRLRKPDAQIYVNEREKKVDFISNEISIRYRIRKRNMLDFWNRNYHIICIENAKCAQRDMSAFFKSSRLLFLNATFSTLFARPVKALNDGNITSSRNEI